MKKEDVMGYLFSVSSRYYKKAMNHEMEKYEVTTAHCAVIRVLHGAGDSSQAEIAEHLRSDRATIGTVIDKLTQKGLVQKLVDSKDKRANLISLTPKAREIAPKIQAASEAVSARALQGFTPEEKAAFFNALAKIVANLSE